MELYSSTEDYIILAFIFIILGVVGRLVDGYLKLRTDKEFDSLINDILQQDTLPLTEVDRLEDMEVVKEAILLAYDMDEDEKAEQLGVYLNQLRALVYKR
jgi:hypothetical protein